jgi:hypothetical protein
MDEKNNILSKFESLKKNNPYKVPEDYFNTLLPRIQEKIEADKKRTGIAWVFSFNPVVKLSFLVVGIVFIAVISFKILKPFWSSNHNSNSSIDEIVLYLDNQVYSIDDFTLLSVFETNKDASNIKSSNQNDTINYLLNNDIGIEDIISEL